MTAHYRTLYQCCKCNSVLDISSSTLEITTCSCGAIKITQATKASTGEKQTTIDVKHTLMQLADPGPYLRRALA
jgi:hypothetical protein